VAFSEQLLAWTTGDGGHPHPSAHRAWNKGICLAAFLELGLRSHTLIILS
jgi:hypothetical protein